MAFFDYTCKECGKTSELMVHSADEKVSCPNCGSGEMEKQFTAQASAVMRGGGAASGGCCGGSCPGRR